MSFTKSIPARRVLVIDDNVDAAEMLVEVMRALGHSAAQANDGETGIELAMGFQPDIIFLDLGMPKMNGFDAAVELRKIWNRPTLRIVALSGWKDEQTAARALSCGCDAHIGKPASIADLNGALAER